MKNILKYGGLWVIAIVVVVIVFTGEDQESAAEAVVSTTQAVEQTTTTTEPAPTTTTTVEVSSSGDWVSEEAYAFDMEDSLTKTSDIAFAVVDVLEGVANGIYSPSDGAYLLEQARASLGTHRDYFRNTEAPEGWETSHRLIQESWDVWDQAFVYLIDGVEFLDFASIDMATLLMDEATILMDQATQAMPVHVGVGA